MDVALSNSQRKRVRAELQRVGVVTTTTLRGDSMTLRRHPQTGDLEECWRISDLANVVKGATREVWVRSSPSLERFLDLPAVPPVAKEETVAANLFKRVLDRVRNLETHYRCTRTDGDQRCSGMIPVGNRSLCATHSRSQSIGVAPIVDLLAP